VGAVAGAEVSLGAERLANHAKLARDELKRRMDDYPAALEASRTGKRFQRRVAPSGSTCQC
jgi:hypothetical protein